MNRNSHGRSPPADILGVPFDLLSYDQATEAILTCWQSGRRGYVVLANPHSVLTCRRDSRMAQAANSASLVLPDGGGIILASRILGYPHHGRVAGPTLMLRLCDSGRQYGWRHYFHGGSEGIAEQLATTLCERYPGLAVAGTCCPPFRLLSPREDQQIVDEINASRPDVVWVGLGAPKQEKWMLDHADRIKAPILIGVGAAFDFHSGRVPWAPSWIRRLGLEWAYRLALEPKRLWRRNLDSPLFVLHVLRQKTASLVRRGPSRPQEMDAPCS